MAGTNQSTNLTGMLSQIGDTLGRERDISSLTRGIENMSRPSGMFGGPAPGTAEYDQQLVNWQTRMGRPEEARATAAMSQEKRLRAEAQASAAEASADDAYAARHTALYGERDRAIAAAEAAAPNSTEYRAALQRVSEIDTQLSAAGAQTSSQLGLNSSFKDIRNGQKERLDAVKVGNDVSYVDALDDFIAREDIDPDVRAAAAGKREQYLNKPGVREALATRAEQNAKIKEKDAAVTELQAQQDGEKAIREAFAAGGLKAAAEAAANHPAAEAVFKAIKDAEEVSDKYRAMPTTLKANELLAKDITTSIASLPENIPATVRAGFANRLKAIEEQGLIPDQAHTAQERMLTLYKNIGELNTRVILAKQAGDASAAAGRQATVDAIDTSTSSPTQLAIAAREVNIPWTQAFADFAAGKSQKEGDPAIENYRLLQEIAKDLRLTPEMGQRFARDANGGIKMEGGQPVKNPNFEAERAKYINAPSTAPSNSDNPPEGFETVNQ